MTRREEANERQILSGRPSPSPSRRAESNTERQGLSGRFSFCPPRRGADKCCLGGQVLTSFVANNISMEGKSCPGGQVHTPCATERDKQQLEGQVHN
ncbi:hypothetical protein TNCV_2135511 [Trichonephila clavipes]|nr:hypothetical protein TNCV_2135511 [Trichonephila clavipes]